MREDLFRDAIEETAKKYVKDNVKVSVYVTYPKEHFSTYTLQLDYKIYHTSYQLHTEFARHEGYIMRVVSDLCNNLADMTQRKRNDFFKRSDE